MPLKESPMRQTISIFSTRSFLIIGTIGILPFIGGTGVSKELLDHAYESAGDESIHILVEPGTEQEAINYYNRILTELGIGSGVPVLDQTITHLLEFCGYGAFLALDIETLDSRTMMNYATLRLQVTNPPLFQAAFDSSPFKEDDVLVSRFFAPKISDVSNRGGPVSFGWRKIVRLKARPDSEASKKGVKSLFLLFNIFQDIQDINEDPFKNSSGNNQAIIVRNDDSTLKDPIYWFVYGQIPDGRIQTFLPASFDARDPRIPSISRYYVPHACADCHGGLDGNGQPDYDAAKLNYLDSDHWFDRVQWSDDFDAMQRSINGIIFDGGKVRADGGVPETTPEFAEAFKVIRKLNSEIRDQTASQTAGSFQLRAVETWLENHKSSELYVSPLDRALLKGDPADRAWDKSDPVDQGLLPMLNRYCFRCHSSLKYHVFDKEMVFDRKAHISVFIKGGLMPQDRQLEQATIDRIEALVKELR